MPEEQRVEAQHGRHFGPQLQRPLQLPLAGLRVPVELRQNGAQRACASAQVGSSSTARCAACRAHGPVRLERRAQPGDRRGTRRPSRRRPARSRDRFGPPPPAARPRAGSSPGCAGRRGSARAGSARTRRGPWCALDPAAARERERQLARDLGRHRVLHREDVRPRQVPLAGPARRRRCARRAVAPTPASVRSRAGGCRPGRHRPPARGRPAAGRAHGRRSAGQRRSTARAAPAVDPASRSRPRPCRPRAPRPAPRRRAAGRAGRRRTEARPVSASTAGKTAAGTRRPRRSRRRQPRRCGRGSSRSAGPGAASGGTAPSAAGVGRTSASTGCTSARKRYPRLGHRLDEARRGRRVAQRLADLVDGDVQGRVEVDERVVGPERRCAARRASPPRPAWRTSRASSCAGWSWSATRGPWLRSSPVERSSSKVPKRDGRWVRTGGSSGETSTARPVHRTPQDAERAPLVD